LCTNAIKHAFPAKGNEGLILVSVNQQVNTVKIVVEDNGVGMKEEPGKKSFGMNLIRSIVYSLKAELSITSENGAMVQVIIPLLNE